MGLVAVYLPVPHTLSGSLMCVIYDTYTTHQGAIDEVHSSQTKLVQLLQCWHDVHAMNPTQLLVVTGPMRCP